MKTLLLLLLLSITISAEIVRLEDNHQYVKFSEGYDKNSTWYLAHSGACDKCSEKQGRFEINLIKFLKKNFKEIKGTK